MTKQPSHRNLCKKLMTLHPPMVVALSKNPAQKHLRPQFAIRLPWMSLPIEISLSSQCMASGLRPHMPCAISMSLFA